MEEDEVVFVSCCSNGDISVFNCLLSSQKIGAEQKNSTSIITEPPKNLIFSLGMLICD